MWLARIRVLWTSCVDYAYDLEGAALLSRNYSRDCMEVFVRFYRLVVGVWSSGLRLFSCCILMADGRVWWIMRLDFLRSLDVLC